MSQLITLNAETRTDVGKGASRRLRRLAGKVPGIMYGGTTRPPNLLTLDANELSKAMQQEAFFSQILNVMIDGQEQQAVLRDMQRNPANDRVMHIDFLRVRADRELQVNVPLHFINEDICVGVKMEGGSIAHSMIEVEIACLPANLPENIEVDMAEVGLNEVVHLSDLKVPEGVQIVALQHGDDHDLNVASVQAPRGGGDEEELVDVAAEDAEASDDAPEAEGGGGE